MAMSKEMKSAIYNAGYAYGDYEELDHPLLKKEFEMALVSKRQFYLLMAGTQIDEWDMDDDVEVGMKDWLYWQERERMGKELADMLDSMHYIMDSENYYYGNY